MYVERETALSLLRGLVQMVFVGMVLSLLLHGNALVGVLILLAMTFAAAVTASRRAQGIKDALLLCFYAIAAGAGVVEQKGLDRNCPRWRACIHQSFSRSPLLTQTQ